MNTRDEILAELPNFYGTEHYYKWSALFPKFVLTDGAKFVAESCDAYWLMDLIASHLPKYQAEGFGVAYLKVKEGKGKVQIEDGNDHVQAKQRIEYTDFPLDALVLYVVPQDDLWVILLPSEY